MPSTWEQMMGWGGRVATALDPTPGNWIIKSALPWYSRNIEKPWAAGITAHAYRKVPWWETVAGGGKPLGSIVRSAVSPQTMKKYEAWKAPSWHTPIKGLQFGVKGAAELSTPTNWLGPAALGKGTAAVGSKAAQTAFKAGAPRLAGGLARGANVAFKTGEVLEHPLESVTKGPAKVYGKAGIRDMARQNLMQKVARNEIPGITKQSLEAEVKRLSTESATRKALAQYPDIETGGALRTVRENLGKTENLRTTARQSEEFKARFGLEGTETGGTLGKEPWQMSREEFRKGFIREQEERAALRAEGLEGRGINEELYGQMRDIEAGSAGMATPSRNLIAEADEAYDYVIKKAVREGKLRPESIKPSESPITPKVVEPKGGIPEILEPLEPPATRIEANKSVIHGQEMKVGDDITWMSGGTWDGRIKQIFRNPSGTHDIVVDAIDGQTHTLKAAEHYGVNLGKSKFHPDIKAKMPAESIKPVQNAIPETVTTPPSPQGPIPATTGAGQNIPPTPPVAQAVPPNPINPAATGKDLDEMLLNAIKDAPVMLKEQQAEYTAALRKKFGAARGAMEGKTGEEAMRSMSAQLWGELPKQEFQPFKDIFTQPQVDELYDRIRQTFPNNIPKTKQSADALRSILEGGAIPTASEQKLLQRVFGDDFVQMLAKKAEQIEAERLSLLSKIRREAVSAGGLMRAVEATFDQSAVLRQGFLLGSGNPKEWAINTLKGFAALPKEEAYKAVMAKARSNPLAPLLDFAGVELTDLTGALTKHEEAFMTRWANKLPIIKQCQRSYVTILNGLRADVFYKGAERWAQKYPEIAQAILKGEDPYMLVSTAENLVQPMQGSQAVRITAETVANATRDLKDLGRLVNIASGRGELGAFKNYAPTINALAFSGRLVASRFEYVPMGIAFAVRSPAARREFIKELIGASTFVGSILGMAYLAGARVEMDPRSTDWGKVRVGDTRIDLMGGFQPYIRYTTQILTGQRKSSSGRVYTSNRATDFARFLRSKEAPAVGLIHDVVTGESFIGEDVDLNKESVARIAYNKFVPLFIQDMYDAVKQEGGTGAALALPGGLGAGVTSYGPESHSVKEYRDKVAQKTYGMDWETLGKTKGKLYQYQLEKTDPRLIKIVAKQEDEKLKAAGVPKTVWDRWYSGQNNIQNESKKALADADAYLRAGEMTPKQFRLRVDEILGNARYARDLMDTDPQYKTVRDFLNTPSGKKMAVSDIAYNEYISTVFSGDLSDPVGKYDYAGAEQRKQAILQKYGPETYQYIQQRLALNRDDTQSMAALRKARETLKPYWDIQDRVWAQFPQFKQINDQIVMLEASDPEAATRALKRYPQIVRARKMIAQQKKLLRQRSPAIEQALIFYR